MRLRLLLALLVCCATALAAVGTPNATAGPQAACASGAHGSPGYSYAGHQNRTVARGVRATITPTEKPDVRAGHVAGWVGVGDPGQGDKGATAWIQAGIAGVPELGLIAYVEIMRPGAPRRFVALPTAVAVGTPVTFEVVELTAGSWQVRVDGKAVTKPVRLGLAASAWKPIATGESYDGGRGHCNGFRFRFEDVRVRTAGSDGWSAFAPGARFVDRGHVVRRLAGSAGQDRAPASAGYRPYAFLAATA